MSEVGMSIDLEEHAEQTLTRSALLVCVSLGKPGNTKSVKIDGETVKIDVEEPAMVRVSKKLIAKDYFQMLLDIDREIRSYMTNIALPSHFKAGMYLVSNALVPQVHAYLKNAQQRRQIVAEKFMELLPQAIARACGVAGERGQLGGLADPLDYASRKRVEESFSFETRYISLDTPRALKEISGAIFDQEKEALRKECVAASDHIKAALREGFAQLVERFAHGLSEKDDGKKRRLHESTVEEMQTFLNLFNDRNIFGDQELSAYVEQAKALVSGRDLDTLRTDEQVRGDILGGFSAIAQSLEKDLHVAPKRKFRLAEESPTQGA